jgi:hypothetical protein
MNREESRSFAKLRDEIYHHKRLGLIELNGRGRGAVWFLPVKDTE